MNTWTTRHKLRDDILKQHAPSVRRRAELEYAVICAVIRQCTRAGFKLHSVAWDEFTPTRTREEALRLIFDLDDCTLRFKRAGDERLYGVYLVLGNDGWDVIADYTWDGGDDYMQPAPGTFAAVIETAIRPFVERYS